jgi:UDP-N-acetylmuramyl pentapeptide phosphotransferase/UDP-N-acetylglucosamine-1-phosphate transferase
MHWRDFRVFIYFIVAAVVLGVVSWKMLPSSAVWVAPVVALGLLLTGLGINNLVLTCRTNKKIEAIQEMLVRIEQMQEAIQKEQEKQSGSQTTIVPTLQAFTQLYMDSIADRQSEEEQQETAGDA